MSDWLVSKRCQTGNNDVEDLQPWTDRPCADRLNKSQHCLDKPDYERCVVEQSRWKLLFLIGTGAGQGLGLVWR